MSTGTIARQEKKREYPKEFRDRETIKHVLDRGEIRGGKGTDWVSPSMRIAGRIMARRDHGKHLFFDLMDQTGTLQLHVSKVDVEDGIRKGMVWGAASECDLGDMVGVEGTIGRNPRGEPLFKVSNWTLLAKALREPPDKYHGLNNPEMKYRHRELDLMANEDSRKLFKMRSDVLFEIRSWLREREYIEIETPTLQPIYGGATAEPFITRHKALGQDYFLSISSELYLKRALVGGFDRVFSVSRCFRNEGISTEHNPEFTNVEIFSTCETYETMAALTKKLIAYLAKKFGTNPDTVIFNDIRMGMPASDWPLSRKHVVKDVYDINEPPVRQEYAEAWELYSACMEIASGASDLNDPVEQKNRLYNQWSPGDEGYNPYDENYIEALEQGALPWAGVGIGIDRLMMLLTGKTNIRDVILFPTLKSNA